jgi:hypothetical protein
MLTRCPTCAEWYEADELAHATDADPALPADRCPADGTAVRVPDRRPPPPPHPGVDKAVDYGCGAVFASAWAWAVVGLPLLFVAGIVTWVTGNWLFLVAWILLSGFVLLFWALFFWALGGGSGKPMPTSSQPTPPRLIRCPACREWYAAGDLVRAGDPDLDTPADRCPRDGSVLPLPWPPRPPASAGC